MKTVLWISAVLWAAFAWWSWRWVRRHQPRTPVQGLRSVAWLGMGPWGVMMWVTMSLSQAARAVDMDLFHAAATGRFYAELALNLAMMYPLALWGDFLWRRRMSAAFGIRDDPAPPTPPAE